MSHSDCPSIPRGGRASPSTAAQRWTDLAEANSGAARYAANGDDANGVVTCGERAVDARAVEADVTLAVGHMTAEVSVEAVPLAKEAPDQDSRRRLADVQPCVVVVAALRDGRMDIRRSFAVRRGSAAAVMAAVVADVRPHELAGTVDAEDTTNPAVWSIDRVDRQVDHR